MPVKPKPRPIDPLQRQLWAELNTTIRECGGWAVSEPNTFPLRLECEEHSELPTLLMDMGHNVRYLGVHERLMPVTETVIERGSNRKVTRQHVEPGVAAVYELSIIKKLDLVARR
jgi:hypothetical protein